MTRFVSGIAVVLLATGCAQVDNTDMPASASEKASAAKANTSAMTTVKGSMTLDAALQAQPAEAQARYGDRHPKETLEFFGIKPGMTVIEGLPGGGWYSKILIPYLGPQGHLIGVDYAEDMWPLFGFFSDEFIKAKETWAEDWTAGAREWYGARGAKVSAFTFGNLPAKWHGKADAALMIRASHNLARFEADGGYMSQALADLYAALKPGGIVGVVQHQAPDDASDEWASGAKGYLKKQFVIDTYKAAGFELVGDSGINHNHRDKPTEADIVWRLPPTLITSRENPELATKMKAIGESHRMTLKFRKPM